MARLGLCNGCFDLFHEGHREFLEHAQSMCDILIIGVNDDLSVEALKGEGRPVETLWKRLAAVAPYGKAVFFDGDANDLIWMYQPDIIIRGWDQEWESAYNHPLVREIAILPRYGKTSTTGLLKCGTTSSYSSVTGKPQPSGSSPLSSSCLSASAIAHALEKSTSEREVALVLRDTDQSSAFKSSSR